MQKCSRKDDKALKSGTKDRSETSSGRDSGDSSTNGPGMTLFNTKTRVDSMETQLTKGVSLTKRQINLRINAMSNTARGDKAPFTEGGVSSTQCFVTVILNKYTKMYIDRPACINNAGETYGIFYGGSLELLIDANDDYPYMLEETLPNGNHYRKRNMVRYHTAVMVSGGKLIPGSLISESLIEEAEKGTRVLKAMANGSMTTNENSLPFPCSITVLCNEGETQNICTKMNRNILIQSGSEVTKSTEIRSVANANHEGCTVGDSDQSLPFCMNAGSMPGLGISDKGGKILASYTKISLALG